MSIVVRVVCLLSAAAAFGCGPTGQRIACTDDCQSEHDQCILHATNADLIQRCDGATNECLAVCQQY